MNDCIKTILDPGSTHLGNYEIAKKIVENCAIIGADAIKFQLFSDIPPNIELPTRYFGPLVKFGNKIGVEIFASVFDRGKIDILTYYNCKSIKFAYISDQNGGNNSYNLFKEFITGNKWKLFDNIYVSGDIMCNPYNVILELYDDHIPVGLAPKIKTLFCVPQYPTYQQLSFNGIFNSPGFFNGFSDHTMGHSQTLQAIKMGATIIEKHVCNKNNNKTPDNKFSLSINAAKNMLYDIKRKNSYEV